MENRAWVFCLCILTLGIFINTFTNDAIAVFAITLPAQSHHSKHFTPLRFVLHYYYYTKRFLNGKAKSKQSSD